MDKNEALLQEIYKNVKMGSDSIINLMDRVGDDGLRREMKEELITYRQLAAEATDRLGERGLKPQELPASAKMGAKIGMAFNTMLDTSASHLAEMMINGSTMGIIEMEKKLNDAPDCPRTTRDLAGRVVEFEKASAERLTKFL